MAVVPLAPKCDITALSDDEAAPAAPLAGHCAPEQLAAAAPKRDSEGRSKGKGQGPDLALLRSKILRLQGTLCTCSRSRGRVRSCFGQFSGTQFDAIVDMNIRLRKMVKEDMDLEVIKLLRDKVTPTSRKGQSLLEKPVCQNAFRRLLTLGPLRFEKLKAAASNNTAPPMDGRRRPRRLDGTNKESIRKRALVEEFLERLYHTLSEPMPELTARARVDATQPPALRPLRFRRTRGKRPGKQYRKQQLPHATTTTEPTPMRLLPPGSFTDYLQMFHTEHPAEKISLKLFTSVWGQSFSHRMAIREASRHAQCGVCLRHKTILSKLQGDQRGRQSQMNEYMKHLARQYSDRTVYWRSRATSRLPLLPDGRRSITMITDGMDKSKFRVPRTRLMSSKDFAGFVRPSLDMSCCICHGWNLVLAVSPPHLKKDSSWCVDLVSHSLNQLGSKIDLRSVELLLQSDNCGRGTKNNTLTRWAGMLVGCHRLARIELRFLETGHSHEDVDQYFSAVATFIEQHAEIHTVFGFKDVLDKFHRDRDVRPHELDRYTHVVTTTRDWKNYLQIGCHYNHIKGIAGRGAPHVFAFDRASDIPGLDRSKVRSRFWLLRGVGRVHHPSDVIMRTKRWMSDAEFDPEPLLYLPTAVCQQLAESGAVPEVAGEDREFDDKGAANWIKYAEMMREDPFNMTEAADYLESLAHNTFERFPPLPIDRCLLAPGPAVGPGLSGGFQDGVCLDAEPNALNLQVEKLQKNVLDKYKIKRRRHHVYKAAARLWGQGVDFNEALGIVEFAFDAATTEADN